MKNQKIAFLFPGQGTQYVGMGKDFILGFAEAKEVVLEADEYLKRKLSSIFLEGPEDVLVQTKNSQLAIFIVSIAILKVIEKNFPFLKPFLCAGLSLGEYSAAVAAGIFTFKDALLLVEARSAYMNEACQKQRGGMSVVLGLSGDVVQQTVQSLNLPQDLWVANFNCPGQVVISGTFQGLKAGEIALKKQGAKRVLPLNVHGAFHSGLMEGAKEKLKPHVMEVSLNTPKSLFVMNAVGGFVDQPQLISQYLIDQVVKPVLWKPSLSKMEEYNVDLYLEIGPGQTLAGFNKRLPTKAPTVSIGNLSDLDFLTTL